MTNTSCSQHDEPSHFLYLESWHSKFCKGNPCAAMLLAYFSSWHDWKLRHDQYYRRFNDIAEMHGDGRPHNQNAYLFFTMDELVIACLNFFGKQAIRKAIELLVELKVISVNKNPNPRYRFDKTKYFRFFPEVIECWKHQHSGCTNSVRAKDNVQVVDNFDNPLADDRKAKSGRPLNENRRPSQQNGQPITDNTNNTTNNNQSINARDGFAQAADKAALNLKKQDETQPIITALTEKGMPTQRFYSDVIDEIYRLCQTGATVEVFEKAYDLSARATQGREFGVPYLVKVVKGLLTKDRSSRSKDPPRQTPKDRFSETVYESDTRNARKWMKGEDKCKQPEEQK